MFYRVFVAGIVGFWLLMGTMLVRTELFPNRGNRLPVPVDYVGGLIFRHEEASSLALYSQKRRLDGSFHLQPKRLPTSAGGKTLIGNLLSLSGNFLLSLPGLAGQRVVFHGGLEVGDHEQVQRVDFSVSLHEPKQNTSSVTLHLDGRPADNQWHYQITQGTVTLREGSGTPAELIDQLDLRGYGVDSRVFSQVGTRVAATTLSAHRGLLRISDEDIETFVVTVHQGDGMDTEIHVNQFGQVLAVKTFLGYDLYDESLAP